jgi:hypothetical protein
LLSFGSESSSKLKGVGGSDLLVRDLVVVVEIELCERRRLVSLGGFGRGLRCDSSDPLGVLLADFETFCICSESDELSLSSRPNGDCCGESMLVVVGRERESSCLKNDDVLVLVHVLALVLGLESIFRKP